MVQIILFAGKVIFLVVLYTFVLMVVRAGTKDLKVQQQAKLVAGFTASAGAAPVPTAARAVPPVGWALVVEAGPGLPHGQVFELPLGAFLVIGRASDAHVQLHDTFVSSHHARVEAESQGLSVEDLGSTNGTSADGREVPVGERVLLHVGGRLAVGDTIFVVEER
jgi:hypothetical protein